MGVFKKRGTIAFVAMAVVAFGVVVAAGPQGSALIPVADAEAQQLYGASGGSCGCDSGNCDVGTCTGGSCITGGSQAGKPKSSRTCSTDCTCGLTIGSCS